MSQITKPIQQIFQTPCTILIVAKRFSGKSHLLKWIIYNLIKAGRFDGGMIFSQTASTSNEYDFIPEDYIHDTFDPEVLEKLFEKQKESYSKGKKSQIFVILDDYIGSLNINTPIIKTICSVGRHVGITVFLSSQKFTSEISPLIRDNCDYFLCFKQSNTKVLKLIYEEYASSFSDYKTFLKWFNENIQNYNALLINNKTQSNAFNDKYSLIKAPKTLPTFKFTF